MGCRVTLYEIHGGGTETGVERVYLKITPVSPNLSSLLHYTILIYHMATLRH
jgi:hypothetical protein